MLVLAAVLLFAIGAAHSYLGERYILIRLFRRTDLPRLYGSDRFTRRTLRFAWHITTVAWWGFGGILLAVAAADGPPARSPLLTVVAVTFGVSAAIAAGASRGRHLSWVVFGAVAILAALAAR